MIDRQRLKNEMERHGLSQGQLALLAGVSASSVQQILNGKVKHPRSLRDLAAVLGVSTEWLEGLSNDPGRKDEPSEPLDSQQLGVPYVTAGWAAGERRPFSEVTDRVFFIGMDWLLAGFGKYLPNDIAMFRVTDSSMAPTIMPDEDILVINVGRFTEAQGSIWMVDYDGSVFICRVRRIRAAVVVLFGDNPVMPTMEIDENALHYIGKVVWQGRRIIP